MKSIILLIKQILYPIILTLTLFKIFFSTAISNAESFDIKNIEISKKFNMNFQKIDVLDEGFKIAYQNLILSITKSTDQDELKNLQLFNIKTMIDNFSIKEEKFIDDIYYVNLDVSFNKKKVFLFLEKKNIFPSLPKSKKILFIPLIIEEEKKNLAMFSENIFYKNWLINTNNKDQLIYILPSEDLDDIQIIKSKYDSLEKYDFEEIINKYSLENYIICLIYKNNNDLRILSKIKLSDKIVLDNKVFESHNSENLLDTIVKLKTIYEDYWKKENQINTSIKLPLTIAMNILDEKKINDFESFIKKFDLVSSYNVSKLDNNKIYYRIIFNGTPQAFIFGVRDSGFALDIKNKIWVLK